MPFPASIATYWQQLRQVRRWSYTYRGARWLRHLWDERITRPGKYVIVAAMTTAIAGSFPETMIGASAFSSFSAFILLALVLSVLYRPKVTTRRSVSPRCVAGSRVPLRIELHNESGKDAFDVGAYEYRLPRGVALQGDAQYVARLAPGQEYGFEYKLRVGRRGVYHLPGPSVISAFPFGLMQSRRFHADPHRLVVYPAFHRLTRLDVPVGQRYQPGGIALTSHVGESMEFIGNREYRPGDRVRDLHVRSWARVGYPVVKQFQEEFLTRVAMIVDTHIPTLPRVASFRLVRDTPRARGERALETNLSLAAAVADYLARQEYVVDLFAAGPELYYFQAGRSLAYLDNILDILACIECCREDPFDVIAPRFSEEIRQISTVIALFLDWDQRRHEFVQRLQNMGVEVKTIVVSDTVTPGDIIGAGPRARVVTPEAVRQGIESI